MMDMFSKEDIVNLYRQAATVLPDDIVFALKSALENESDDEDDSEISKNVLSTLVDNINKAKSESRPLCQDTGIPVFYIKHPQELSQKRIKQIINEATVIATEQIPLRANAVDSLTGKSLGNLPHFHFEESNNLEINLLLKGGGSENVSAIYKLPNVNLDANRDLDGVRKCVLEAIFKAQGSGCPPYIVGIALGGSIEQVAKLAKKQLLRKLDDKNKNLILEKFENALLADINKLGIGPMGLGGKTTALAVKINAASRHPASFFVGISIGCWSMRRAKL